MAEVAGQLEVPVVADLTGFAQKLRRAVEAAAEGVTAKIAVEIEESGLRRELTRAVEAAAAGVKARVGVEVDRRDVRSGLSDMLGRIGQSLRLPLGKKGDLPKAVAAEAAAAQVVAEANPVEVPVRTDRRLVRDLLLERLRAQATARAAPVEVPLTMRLARAGAGLRGLGMAAILPLIQPLVAALGSAAAGFGALGAAAAPAVGVLGAVPGLLTSIGSLAGGVVVSIGGLEDAFKAYATVQEKLARGEKLSKEDLAELKRAMDGVSPSTQLFIKRLYSLRDEWEKTRKAVQEPLFAALARQIRPVADNLLPALRNGLAETNRVVGSVIDSFGHWMSTPAFRSDFKTILAGNNALLQAFGHALLDLARAFNDVVVASQPFLRRVGRAVEAAGVWVREWAAAGRESGRFAAFLDRAGNTASQLWRIIRDLGSGLFGVFRAGTEQGEQLLDSIERAAAAFDDWANGEGQRVLRQWYEDAMPAFRELAGLAGDIGRALGRMSTDPRLAGMIQQVRDQLLPAIENFLTTISGHMAPQVVDMLSSLADALQHLAEAGGPLATFIEILDTGIDAFNRFADQNPGVVAALGQLLGALLAFRAAKGILSIFKLGGAGGLLAGLLAGGKGGKGGGLAASLFAGVPAAARSVASRVRQTFANSLRGVGNVFGRGAGKGAEKAAKGIDRFTKAVDGSKAALGTEMVADAAKETALDKVGGAADRSGKRVGGFTRAVDATKRVLGTAVTALGGWAQAAVTGAASVGSAAVRGAASFARATAQVVAGAARQGVAMATTAARVAAAWVLMGVQALIHAARVALAWVIAMGPIGWIIAAVIAAVALIILNWDKVKTFLIAAWNVIWTTAKKIWAAIVSAVSSAATGMRNLVVSIVQAIQRRWNAFWGAVKAIARTVFNAVVNFVKDRIAYWRAVVSAGMAAVKRAIEGLKALPGRVRAFFQQLVNAVREKLRAVVDRVVAVKDRIVGFFRGAGRWLKDAGRRVIQGLIDGITEKIGALRRKISSVAQTIRDHLPFSPAKVGPLSGKGDPFLSGRSIARNLAAGVESMLPAVRRASQRLAGAAQALAADGSPTGAAMRRITGLVAEPPPGDPWAMWKERARHRTFTPVRSSSVTFEDGAVRIYNPAPEPASESAAKRLPRIAQFGLFS